MYDRVEKPKQKSRALANLIIQYSNKQIAGFSNTFNHPLQLVTQLDQVEVDLKTESSTFHGLSNNKNTTESKMNKTFGGNNVRNIFSNHVNKVEGWSIFNCAEPNAFSEMVNSCNNKKDFMTELQSARMGQASVVDGDPLDRCRNCRQWLKGSPSAANNRIFQPLITDLIKKN
jgi:hypothetical protein